MLTFGNTYLNFGGTYLNSVAGVVTSFLNPNVVVKASKLNESTTLHFRVMQENNGYLMYWPTQNEVGNQYTYSTTWTERDQSYIVPSGNLWSGTMTSTPVNECWVYTSPCNADSSPVKSDLSLVIKGLDTPVSTYSAVSWTENTGKNPITIYALNPEVTATSTTLVSICFDRFNSAAQFKPYDYMVDCTPLAWDNGVYSVERADLYKQSFACFNDSGCYRISNLSAFNTSELVGTWDISQDNELKRRHFPLQIKDSVFSGGGSVLDYKHCLFTYEARNVSSCAVMDIYTPKSADKATFYAHNLINCSGVTVLERSKTSAYAVGDVNQNYDSTSGMFNTVGWWENNGVWTYNDNSAYNPLSSESRMILSSVVCLDPTDQQWHNSLIRDSVIGLSGGIMQYYPTNAFYQANISNTMFHHTRCTADGNRLIIPNCFLSATFNNTQIGEHKVTGYGYLSGNKIVLNGTWTTAVVQ